MTIALGYFIPEFPGQTHIFFWREMRALRELGIRPEPLSTRHPPAAVVSHAWSRDAVRMTSYLTPFRARSWLGAASELLRAGPRGWWRCLRSVARAEAVSAPGRLRLLALAVAGAQTAWLARRAGWSHVHAHSCGDSANIAMFASLLSGLPYSVTLHGPLDDYGPNQPEKWRHAAFAVVITRTLLGEVQGRLAGSLPPTVALAPMGVEVETFRRAAPYRPWDGRGPCRIFSCGRINPCKGHDDLIRAVALLRDRGVEAHLRIAGAAGPAEAAYKAELERLIRDLALDDRVTLLGAQPEEAVRAEIESAHLFALASLHEPLGVAIMEAMAMEAPIVATGAGGVRELIDDGIEGLLVEPRDPGRMADAMLRILQDPDRSLRMGAAGRRKVAASFHSHVSARTIARCLGLPDAPA